MKFSAKLSLTAALSSLIAASAVLACGTPPPQAPPPPPPDPPIVCCQVIARWPCPIDPCNFEYWIVCYGRIDGLPLFVSNPMLLFPNQQCICAFPALSQAAVLQGAKVVAFNFTDPQKIPWDPTQIPDEPGYGPFQPVDDPIILAQIDEFVGRYTEASGIPVSPTSAFGFGPGPDGGEILPGIVFNCYVTIRVPRGFGKDKLCPPLFEGSIGLYLVEDGQVFLEPVAPGLPPIPPFAFVPGDGAMYKFRWYPVAVPPSCPPPFLADNNGDGVIDTADLGILIGAFGSTHPCP